MTARYAPGEATMSPTYAWLYAAGFDRDRSIVVRVEAARCARGTEPLYVGNAFHGESASERRVWVKRES